MYLHNLTDLKDLITNLLQNSDFTHKIEEATALLTTSIQSGHKVLIAGNGGSAAEAQHFSAELIGRFKKERHPYPSIALSTDTSILTAVGNDYGFDSVFERQVQGLSQKGDILVVLSTSGNSANLIRAVKAAHDRGVMTIGLLGKDGGLLKELVGVPIVVPSMDTARIQEIHLLIIHSLCSSIDEIS